MKVSFIIPVFNNFLYTKNIYENIIEYFPNDEIVISDGGSSDDTISYFSSIKNSNLIFLNNGLLNLCENYNKGVKSSSSDIIILLHNDMYIPPIFKSKLLNNIEKNTIISYARIEPPIFPPEEPGKIIIDFGYNLESLKKEEINSFCEKYDKTYNHGGGRLFTACYREDYLELDEYTFTPPQMWAADDDLYLRYLISGKKLFLSDACVYHFVSRTSRQFDNYQEVEMNSNINFIRKWGFRHSISNSKYDIGFIVKGNYEFIEALEPWCSNIYINDPHALIIGTLMLSVQPNTSYNLSERVIYDGSEPKNEILVYINQRTFTQDDFQIIQQLADIIYDNGSIGKFNLGNLKIEIKQMNDYKDKLIKI